MKALLRGRVVVREQKKPSSLIEIVDNDPAATVTHRGVVLALGPPVRTPKGGAEIPHGFKVGDVVQFHFEATEKGRMTEWDGAPAVVLAQREIDAVIEP
jgi:co-chaperonin GroES (HSP10)